MAQAEKRKVKNVHWESTSGAASGNREKSNEMRPIRRVGLDELDVGKKSWFRRIV